MEITSSLKEEFCKLIGTIIEKSKSINAIEHYFNSGELISCDKTLSLLLECGDKVNLEYNSLWIDGPGLSLEWKKSVKSTCVDALDIYYDGRIELFGDDWDGEIVTYIYPDGLKELVSWLDEIIDSYKSSY